MALKVSTFRLQVLSLIRMLFEGEVESVYISGDEGEYELLPFHFPLLGAIPEGELKIAGHESIPLRAGVVLFQDNQCIVIIEELGEAEVTEVKKPIHKGSKQEK
jgi:F-type H+-transporting ATPase subunit epsilon